MTFLFFVEQHGDDLILFQCYYYRHLSIARHLYWFHIAPIHFILLAYASDEDHAAFLLINIRLRPIQYVLFALFL